jgi:hypothetical protein
LFTGRYPRAIFEFNVGVLDVGGHKPGGTVTPAPQEPAPDLGRGTGPAGPAAGWTSGRIISVVIGALLAVCSLGVLSAGGAAVWADTAQRSAGYVDLGSGSFTTAGRALASDTITVRSGWAWLTPLIGQVRISVAGTGRAGGVFAGIAPASAAGRYLSGVEYTTVIRDGGHGQRINHPGSREPQPPVSTPIWVVQASGAHTASVLWTMSDGDWTLVAMNADRSAGVAVHADVGASLPALAWLATELLAGGTVLALIAFACIIIPLRMAAAGRPATR